MRAAEGAVKPAKAASPPAAPARCRPIAKPTWLDVGPGQDLTDRHQVREGLFAEPFPARHKRFAKIAQMRDRTAERRQPQLQEYDKDRKG